MNPTIKDNDFMSFFIPARSTLLKSFGFLLFSCAVAFVRPGTIQAGEPQQPAFPIGSAESTQTSYQDQTANADQEQPVESPALPSKEPGKADSKGRSWQIHRYFTEAVRLRNFPEEPADLKLSLDEKRKVQLAQYKAASDKFIGEVRRALRETSGFNERMAVVVLIGEIADKDNEAVSDKFAGEVQGKILRALTDDLVELAEPNQPWRLRYVALRALGKITPDPDKAVPVIRKILAPYTGVDGMGSQPELRRAAAYALVDLAKNAHGLPRDSDLPIRQFNTISEVTKAAKLGLADDDELLRAYSLLAVIEAAQSIASYVAPFNADTSGLKIRELDVANVAFVETFAQFQSVNRLMLNCLHDANPKIQFTALEAFEHVFNARSAIVQYLRRKSNKQKEDGHKLLANFKLRDPLEGLILDGGKTVADLLNRNNDIRERRKAIYLLEAMGEELNLGLRDPDPVLNRIVWVLSEKNEDVFVRWSAVNAIKNLIERERDLKEKMAVLKVLISKPFAPANETVDMALVRLVTDPQSSTRLDPDLSVRIANTLESLSDLLNSIGAGDQDKAYFDREKRRLGGEFATLLKEVFYAEPGAGVRFDVDTRLAVMEAVVSLGGAYVTGGLESLIQALEDPDVRIRRDAAKSLSIFALPPGKASPGLIADISGKVVPALTRALRDEDGEVRINASESILTFTKR